MVYYNNNYRNNNYNNNYNNRYNSSNNNRSIENNVNEQQMFNLCLKTIKGEAELPKDVDFSTCYHIFLRWERLHGSYIQCKYQHDSLTCMGCLRNCIPAGKCTRHGHEH